MAKNIVSYSVLKDFLQELPEGTTSDVTPEDLESGNFDQAHFEMPDGTSIDLSYKGSVVPQDENEWRK